jgi:DNA-binding IclR family transcriptional regulator
MTAQPNRSLADGIALLGLLCSTGQLGTRDAALMLGWETTRANRLLGTLRDLGLAEQNASRRYLPGPGVHVLAAQCLQGSRLLSVSLPILRGSDRAGLGVAIGVLWRGQVCYLLHAGRTESLDAGLTEFAPYQADDSSIGLAMEAHLQADRYANSAAARAKAQKDGYGVRRDDDGVHGSVAVPIFGGKDDAPIAGLAFIADLTSHRPRDLAARLRVISAAITQALRASGERPARGGGGRRK